MLTSLHRTPPCAIGGIIAADQKLVLILYDLQHRESRGFAILRATTRNCIAGTGFSMQLGRSHPLMKVKVTAHPSRFAPRRRESRSARSGVISAEFPMPSQTACAVARNFFVVILNGSSTRPAQGRAASEESLRGRFQAGENPGLRGVDSRLRGNDGGVVTFQNLSWYLA